MAFLLTFCIHTSIRGGGNPAVHGGVGSSTPAWLTWMSSCCSGSGETVAAVLVLTWIRPPRTWGPSLPETSSPTSVPVAWGWRWSILASLFKSIQLVELQLLTSVDGALIQIRFWFLAGLIFPPPIAAGWPGPGDRLSGRRGAPRAEDALCPWAPWHRPRPEPGQLGFGTKRKVGFTAQALPRVAQHTVQKNCL